MRLAAVGRQVVARDRAAVAGEEAVVPVPDEPTRECPGREKKSQRSDRTRAADLGYAGVSTRASSSAM